MPRAIWGTPQPASATDYASDEEPRGILGFLGGRQDIGADISDRMGIIAQLLMNAGSGRGGAGIAEATAAANERSAARREDQRNKAMVNRMADKLEPSNPEMAMMMRANTKFGMTMLGRQLENEWSSKSEMDQLTKRFELEGANAQALEAQKQAAIDKQTRLLLEGAGLTASSPGPIVPAATGTGDAAVTATPLSIGGTDSPVTAPTGGQPAVTPPPDATGAGPAPADNIPHEYYTGLPPGPAGQELLAQRLKHRDPEISLSEVTAYRQALLSANETGRQKYFDNIRARTERQARVAGFETRTNEVARQNQALPGINLQQPGQPELMQAGINPNDPSVIPPNQVAQAGQYLRQAITTSPEAYTSALKDVMQPPSAGMELTFDESGKMTSLTTGKKGGGGKDTEADKKHTAFYERGKLSVPTLLEPKHINALRDYTLQAASKVPLVGNALVSNSPYQVADAAAENFLIAVLRLDTGATINPSEGTLYRHVFIPEPGDSDETVKYKAALRGVALEGIRQGQSKENIIATAQDAWRQIDPNAPGAQPPPMPQWAIDEKVSPESWAAHPEVWFADDDKKPKP